MCSCVQNPCACNVSSTPRPFALTDLLTPLNNVASQLSGALAAGHTVAPFELYHVITTEPVVDPDVAAYNVGDVLSLQKLGTLCLWKNRTQDTIIDAPSDLAHITPLEGEGGTVFVTTAATASPYIVDCPDHGFTSVQVYCAAVMRVAATSANLSGSGTYAIMGAGEPFTKTRSPGEPRITPFFVKPDSSSTLRIIYTA